ncbi:MAG TPA: Rieske (2Fe-2S) protein [Tepidisphaeraceae bacterium]|nr:Rieske (2Fe-2S) protein [Tepidisphaeraceae bacterium]
MENLSRREFVAAVTAVAACAGCAMCASAAEGAPASAPAAEKVDIGTLSDYAKDGIYDKFAKPHRFFVIRNEGELYACSSICTHKNSPLAVSVNGKEILCKKHGSKFSEYGTATKGPAKNSLARFAIAEDDKKHLIVDTGTSFSEKNWEKDGSFIKVG